MLLKDYGWFKILLTGGAVIISDENIFIWSLCVIFLSTQTQWAGLGKISVIISADATIKPEKGKF